MNNNNNRTQSSRRFRKRKQRLPTETRDNRDQPAIDLSRFDPLPPKIVVAMKWQESGALANAAATSAYENLNINGIYDVQPSAGGASAAGFTQWMTLYNVYRVLSVEVTLRLANLEAFPLRCATGFFPSTNSVFLSSEWENLFCQEHKVLGPLTGISTQKINRSMVLTKLFDNRAAVGDLPNFYGTSATNPTTLMNFCFAVESMNASVLANGANYSITMRFIVELTIPQQLTASVSLNPRKAITSTQEKEEEAVQILLERRLRQLSQASTKTTSNL